MDYSLKDKNIILGVCGGIAAYKSVELLRLLKKGQANVRVIMTRNALHFVGPLTFEALSGTAVCTSLFTANDPAAIRHIDWAAAADAVVVAPATANIIGKIAGGLADDALSTFLLAVTCPVILCPSMNTHMYENKAMQRNLQRLKADGLLVLAPESGQLACGTTGPGRLPEPEVILDRVVSCLSPQDLKGKNILVTAGPTREPVDPVRFMSNPSSGKMGYAVARAAQHRGARTTLIAGPVSLADPPHVNLIRVNTAREMASAVFDNMDRAHVIIKAAAVSDYRAKEIAAHKIKKENDEIVLSFQKNQDILKEVGRRKKHQILVGFAAETQALEANAVKKMTEKNLDMIVGNLVGSPDSGFHSDTNTVAFFFKDGSREALDPMEKDTIAHILLDRIVEKFLK
ncbi:MAG: bifunctional phosphopantothenoylcysteine decarboxylase/phosphopantothenate--cysteine ligase CoaBC [Desulfobacterales bacterium]|nr:bifunctional phosphopantothenoylcysteine decarboxylase/phosphopantothenate--cysteine ligase CoaBC [Desulfobacterales bacterium]